MTPNVIRITPKGIVRADGSTRTFTKSFVVPKDDAERNWLISGIPLSPENFEKETHEIGEGRYCVRYYVRREGRTIAIISDEEYKVLVPWLNKKKAAENEFEHSGDYQTVTWRGQQFKFSVMQALIVQRLYENFPREFTERDLLADVQSDSLRLKDVFKQKKKKHPALGTFILGPERRRYKLNLKKK